MVSCFSNHSLNGEQHYIMNNKVAAISLPRPLILRKMSKVSLAPISALHLMKSLKVKKKVVHHYTGSFPTKICARRVLRLLSDQHKALILHCNFRTSEDKGDGLFNQIVTRD